MYGTRDSSTLNFVTNLCILFTKCFQQLIENHFQFYTTYVSIST